MDLSFRNFSSGDTEVEIFADLLDESGHAIVGTRHFFTNAHINGVVEVNNVKIPTGTRYIDYQTGSNLPNSILFYGVRLDIYGLNLVGILLEADLSSIDFLGVDPASKVGTANTLVPIPAAIWLFGTALIGFVGMSRRRKVT